MGINSQWFATMKVSQGAVIKKLVLHEFLMYDNGTRRFEAVPPGEASNVATV